MKAKERVDAIKKQILNRDYTIMRLTPDQYAATEAHFSDTLYCYCPNCGQRAIHEKFALVSIKELNRIYEDSEALKKIKEQIPK